MALLNLETVKRQLGVPDDGTYDEELPLWMGAATAAVESIRGEAIDPREVTDEVTAVSGTVMLSWLPVISLTSVTTTDGATSWDVSALHVTPSGAVRALSGPALQGTLLFLYNAGYTDPPPNFQLAGTIILQHLWETRRGAMAPQVGGTDDYMPGPGWAIPRRALELLGLSIPGVA